MILKIKKQYEGQVITKRFIGLGNVSVDCSKLNDAKCKHYYNNGFTELFEYVDENHIEDENHTDFVDSNIGFVPSKPNLDAFFGDLGEDKINNVVLADGLLNLINGDVPIAKEGKVIEINNFPEPIIPGATEEKITKYFQTKDDNSLIINELEGQGDSALDKAQRDSKNYKRGK